MPPQPFPTLDEIKAVPVQLSALRSADCCDAFRAAVSLLQQAHRNDLFVALGNIRFDSLAADPCISRLEERPGLKHLIRSVQYSCVWEAYRVFCSDQDTKDERYDKKHPRRRMKIVELLMRDLYGEAKE